MDNLGARKKMGQMFSSLSASKRKAKAPSTAASKPIPGKAKALSPKMKRVLGC